MIHTISFHATCAPIGPHRHDQLGFQLAFDARSIDWMGDNFASFVAQRIEDGLREMYKLAPDARITNVHGYSHNLGAGDVRPDAKVSDRKQ